MTKIVISTICALALSTSTLSANSTKEIKMEAKAAIMKMGKTLKMNMKKSMKEGKLVGAAKFCTKEARNIGKKVNASYPEGTTVKRITLKPRNPKNAAKGADKKVLEEFAAMAKEGKALPKMKIVEVSKGHYKVYKPMTMGKACVKCHGDVKTMNKEAYGIILKKFPNDKAIGYKVGDFRGAILAEIIKK
jgi:hypothetical protein